MDPHSIRETFPLENFRQYTSPADSLDWTLQSATATHPGWATFHDDTDRFKNGLQQWLS